MRSSFKLFRSIFISRLNACLASAFYMLYAFPHLLTRTLVAILLRRKYKIHIIGSDKLPKTGAVLLLGNHISWIDWAILQTACPRPVRFVMLRSIYNRWYLKPFLEFFGIIPISHSGTRESFAQIKAKLKQGEVVCVFPEGSISRTGSLGTFRAGYERAVEGVEGIIVPFYLHGMWGSRLSRADSEKLRKNTARKFRRDVIVAFGKSLPITTKADQLKQKIFELSFEAWERYSQKLDPLPLAWMRTAKKQLKNTCVIEGQDVALTHAKMITATTVFAHKMRKIDREKNVAILLPASRAAIIANMAVMLNGQTAVNLNYTTSVLAVQTGVQNAALKTVYTSEKFLGKMKQQGVDVDGLLKGLRVVFMEQLQQNLSKSFWVIALTSIYLLPASWYYKLFGRRVSINDPAAILFSSGSEGIPKGILLSHRNFMSNIKQVSDVLKTQTDDVMMGCLPPFHSFGLTVTTFLPLVEGIPVVCHPDPTDALNIAKAICRNAVTLMCATSTFLRLYIKNHKVNALMLDSLRAIIAGAEKLSLDVRDEFKAKFNKDIYEGYGATETMPVASVNMPDQLDTTDWTVQVGNKIGTVGMPLPGCSFRVVDPDTLQSLPVGEDGLVLISGTQVMLGYLNDEEKTEAAIIMLEGRRWYKTGDKGHLDSDGFLTIVDRYSRFAKMDGEMISLSATKHVTKKGITHII